MEDAVPFQVHLERRQHRQLKALAERRHASMGALIRESVDAYLATTPIHLDPLLGIIGMFEDSGPRPHGDVALHHDEYLADAVEAEWRELTRG